MANHLATYHAKRNFKLTPEPHGEIAPGADELRFVVQKHHARRLHYDFRLEIGGTLKSWAVPKGPSLDPADKRLAVHVEDHPLDYLEFEGDIPPHQYGAGHVDVWDIGSWEPLGDAEAGYEAGRLKFVLHGEKLQGVWKLVRTGMRGHSDKEQWFLIKEKDEYARSAAEYDITAALPDSVLSGKGSRKQKTTRAKVASEKPATRKPAVKQSTPAPKSAAKKTAAASESAPRLSHAKSAALPQRIAPQLATLVDTVPTSGDWLYEIKYDGYRMLARIEHGKAQLFTRDGNDWTHRLPEQVCAIEKLAREVGIDTAWLDGEVVVLDGKGAPSFHML